MSDEKKPPFHSPFAGLAQLKDQLPSRPAAQAAAKLPRGPERAVVRLERTGRGGKDVTVIEQLGLSERERAAWLKSLKQALGCGGAVEGENLVLQGDQRERVEPVLTRRGVRKVTIGN